MAKRKRQIETTQQRQVYKVLKLFADFSNAGILPLCGCSRFPDDEALFEMIQADYIRHYKIEHHGATPQSIPTKGGDDIPYAQRVVEVADTVKQIIRQAGGVDAFKSAFDELQKNAPRNMQILIDLSRRAGTLETIADIAEKNYLSEPQITNIKKRMLEALAINICGRVSYKEKNNGS